MRTTSRLLYTGMMSQVRRWKTHPLVNSVTRLGVSITVGLRDIEPSVSWEALWAHCTPCVGPPSRARVCPS